MFVCWWASERVCFVCERVIVNTWQTWCTQGNYLRRRVPPHFGLTFFIYFRADVTKGAYKADFFFLNLNNVLPLVTDDYDVSVQKAHQLFFSSSWTRILPAVIENTGISCVNLLLQNKHLCISSWATTDNKLFSLHFISHKHCTKTHHTILCFSTWSLTSCKTTFLFTYKYYLDTTHRPSCVISLLMSPRCYLKSVRLSIIALRVDLSHCFTASSTFLGCQIW